MDINLKLFLDIEDKLIGLDGIFTKYVPVYDNLLYVRGARFPVALASGDKQIPIDDQYNKHMRPAVSRSNIEMVSNTPFYPVHSVSCVAEVLKNMYIANTSYRELYVVNPHIPMYSYAFISTNRLNEEIEDTILSYVGTNITRADMSMITKAIMDIFDYMYSLIPDNLKNNTIYFNIDSEHFVCEIGIDIRAYRYEELHDHIEYNVKPQR
jgi:hypothetical protein